MGATNHTTNYNLSQFIGTDKPSWLNDYNGDMSAIDTAIKAAKDTADLAQTTAGNASATATSASNTVSTLNTQVNTPVTGLAAQVTAHDTDITNIQSAIGNTALPTVAQTLTGAIAEIAGDIPATTGLFRLVSTETISHAFTGGGDDTYEAGMNDVYSRLVTAFSNLTATQYIKLTSVTPNDTLVGIMSFAGNVGLMQTVPTSIDAFQLNYSAAQLATRGCELSASSFLKRTQAGSMTVDDLSNLNPGSGTCILTYEVYETVA